MRHLLSEVDEVVRLVNEEKLQCRPSQVVAPQMNLAELRQRSFEIKPDSWRGHIYYSPQTETSEEH